MHSIVLICYRYELSSIYMYTFLPTDPNGLVVEQPPPVREVLGTISGPSHTDCKIGSNDFPPWCSGVKE